MNFTPTTRRIRAALALATIAIAALLGSCASCSDNACDTTSDCDTGFFCIEGTCVSYGECTDDSDCQGGFTTCRDGFCDPYDTGGRCDDQDGDGFGVGEVGDCPKCLDAGLCEKDCDDNDASIAPDLLDRCDGRDNDCDDEVDEPISCERPNDCPDEAGTIVTCENTTCVYRPPNQLGPECSGAVLACVDGEREDPPAECQ